MGFKGLELGLSSFLLLGFRVLRVYTRFFGAVSLNERVFSVEAASFVSFR